METYSSNSVECSSSIGDCGICSQVWKRIGHYCVPLSIYLFCSNHIKCGNKPFRKIFKLSYLIFLIFPRNHKNLLVHFIRFYDKSTNPIFSNYSYVFFYAKHEIKVRFCTILLDYICMRNALKFR